MNLQVNGERKIITSEKQSITLDLVVEKLGHNPKLIVIEFNGLIIDPKEWKTQIVKDGDNLEIVTIVGGGSYR
mgnify:CR=1 FL=1|tara:strand:+ start:231 stop:449 length:219 start_codon:yes stop_codon:yes gene_type:complete